MANIPAPDWLGTPTPEQQQKLFDARKKREAAKAGSTVQPTPQPAQPTPSTTPTPSAPTAPAAAPTTPPAGVSGLDQKALQKTGIGQEQIDKAQAQLAPSQQLAETEKARATEQNQFIQQDLAQEQKDVEGLYADVKKKKEELTNQSLQIVDETAKVQQDIASQEYQKNLFRNEQAQKQFQLDTARAERQQEQANEEDETRMRQAIAAQLGASFGSSGLSLMMTTKKKGEEILSDLRAQNAIGNAEFSFKAMEIESNYSTKLKDISNTRQADKLKLISTLNDDLTSIDEKVLLSRAEKKQAARDAVKAYYDQLNGIDEASAKKTEEAVTALYEEKDKLRKEKEEKESFNIEMSTALGYYANKFGNPIGVRDGEAPKPFTGQFNPTLSQQFGYLVDERGQAILAADGQKIKFKDFTKEEKMSALERLLSGNATGYDAADVNGSVGRNDAIASAAPEGSYGGQCGTFVRTRFTDEPPFEGKCAGLTGSAMSACSMQAKKDLIDSRGQRREDYVAKVGDILCFTGAGYGSVGHYAIINEISEDGQTYTLTESNMDLKGTVHNTRKVKADNPAIYGGFSPRLKGPFANANPKTVEGSPASEGDETPGNTGSLNQGTVNILKKIQGNPSALIGMKAEERQLLQTFAGSEENLSRIMKGESVEEVLKSATKSSQKLDKDSFDQEMKLRDDFSKGSTEFVKVRDAYNKIQEAAKKKTPAGDMGLIFAYMKILDPGSTVREGEYASAQNATNVPGWVTNYYNAAKDGTKLNDVQRKDFVGLAKSMYESQKVGYDRLVNDTKGLAESYGLDPSRVTFSYENPEATTPDVASGNIKDQISAAKTAGLKSDKILDYLAQNQQYAGKIQQAKSAGLSPDKILEYFNQ